MNMTQAVKTADQILTNTLAEIKAAQASGDVDAMFKAAKRGAKPALIVHKAAHILANPERYEGTQERFKSETDNLLKLDANADAVAKADGFSRFNSAKRRYSAVRSVEKLIESL